MRTIRIGTRGSQLALWQAEFVQNSLGKKFPEHSFRQIIIKTQGDQDQQSSLKQIGGQGVFTKAIETALLHGEIDIAVHSLKDLPSAMTHRLKLGAVPERGPVEDVLVTAEGIAFEDLPHGAKIATGSIRRQSQLLQKRPDLRIADLRGNINTRIRKLHESGLDAIIMARAAIVRLGLQDVRYYPFSTDFMIPAVGQGAVGVQIRENDHEVETLVSALNHAETFIAVRAERMILHTLDSGCQFPVGAYGKIIDKKLHLSAFVGSDDGEKVLYDSSLSDLNDPENAGSELAGRLIRKGALKLLNQ